MLAGTLRLRVKTEDQIRQLKVTAEGALLVTSKGISTAAFPKDQPSASPGHAQQLGLVEIGCQGLNDAIIVSAAWAVNEHGAPQYDRVSQRVTLSCIPDFPLIACKRCEQGVSVETCYVLQVYALTADGQLLVLFITLSGPLPKCKVSLPARCLAITCISSTPVAPATELNREILSCLQVWYRTPVPGSPGAAQMQAIRGYLLLSSEDGIQVFKANSTGMHAVIAEPLQVLAQAESAQVRELLQCINGSSAADAHGHLFTRCRCICLSIHWPYTILACTEGKSSTAGCA